MAERILAGTFLDNWTVPPRRRAEVRGVVSAKSTGNVRPLWQHPDMAAKGNIAKLHHYVPQAYLRGFATERERVTAMPLDSARAPFTASVKNVAARTHFHTVEGLDQPDEFETALSTVEGDAMRIIRALENGELPLSAEDRSALSFYVALQSVRGPDTRNTLEYLEAKIVRVEIGAGGRKNVNRWIKKNLGFDATEAQAQQIWDEGTRPGGPPIKFSNSAHIEQMVQAAERLTPSIVTRPWTLVRFDRRSLITSDAPVSLIRNPEDDPWRGVGFGTAKGISFPLTRKLGLLLSDPRVMIQDLDEGDPKIQAIRAAVVDGKADRVQVGTTEMERLFNEHTAHTAREYLYHHPDDARFVPSKLHGPTLINTTLKGFTDAEFDGEPWFSSSASAGHDSQ